MVAGLVMALIGSLFSILVVSFHFIQYIHSFSPHQFHLTTIIFLYHSKYFNDDSSQNSCQENFT